MGSVQFHFVPSLPVGVCVVNDEECEAFVPVHPRNTNVSGGIFGLLHFGGNDLGKAGHLEKAKPGCTYVIILA